MRFLLLLVMLVISVSGLADDMDEFERMMQEPKDRASWVDPMDMGMLNCEAVERKLRECDRDLGECRIQLDKISSGFNANKSKAVAKLEVKKADPIEKSASPGVSDVFLRRFVGHLLEKLQLDRDQAAHLKVEILLDTFQIQTLVNFVSPGSSTNQVDVDYILSSFIRSVDTYETSPFVDNLKVLVCLLGKEK